MDNEDRRHKQLPVHLGGITLVSYLLLPGTGPTPELPLWAILLALALVAQLILDPAGLGSTRLLRGRTLLIYALTLMLLSWMFITDWMRTGLVPRDIYLATLAGMGLASIVLAGPSQSSAARIMGAYLVGGTTISAGVGIAQYLHFDFATNLWLATGGLARKVQEVQSGQRIAGLASYSIPFGFHISVAAPISVALAAGSRSPTARVAAGLATAILLVAALVSNGRSVILACGLALAILALLPTAKTSRGVRLAVLLMLATTALVVLIHTIESRLTSAGSEETSGRIGILVAAMVVAYHNPLGTGIYGYDDAVSQIMGDIAHIPGAENAVRWASHNQFANMAAYYGLPGLLFLLAILILAWPRLGTTRPIAWPRVVSLAAMVAYVTNSMFHNAGFFAGEPIGWYILALAIAGWRNAAHA